MEKTTMIKVTDWTIEMSSNDDNINNGGKHP